MAPATLSLLWVFHLSLIGTCIALEGDANQARIDGLSTTRDAYHCSSACQSLMRSYGTQVSFPNQTSYNSELAGFWSLQQSQTQPACIFRPSCAEQVADVVVTSEAFGCPFAVKSGGHAAFSGASNIAGGITVDLAELNQITLSDDKSVASIGPGNTWYDVYAALEPHNLVAIGGRVAGIGVGGLILGGGISFFSGLYGWACDNVANYQVVTASGKVINASESLNSDLFWALRGGGNNFGVVTRFDAYVYPQGLMWGGDRIHLAAQNASLIQAMVEFGVNGSVADPKAALILSFAYVQAESLFVADVALEYASPLPNGTHPAVFDNFFDIPGAIEDTTTTQSLSNITLEFNAKNPSGLRESYWAAASSLDPQLTTVILQIWAVETSSIANVTGILPALTLQVITLPQLQHMSRAGGNALGIENETQPLLLVNLNVMWSDSQDDGAVLQTQANIISRSTAAAAARGLDNPYVYMNYASQFQDPISSYGESNKARLIDVAKTYDPQGVFQRLQPGYFKLNQGSQVGNS